MVIGSIPLIIDAGIRLLVSLVENLPEIIITIIEAVPQIITSIVNALIENMAKIIDAGVQLFVALVDNLSAIIMGILAAVPAIMSALYESFIESIGKMRELGVNLISGVWEGIVSMGAWLGEKVSGFFGGVVDSVKSFLGIHSPSTVFAGIGENMAEGLGLGFAEQMNKVADDMKSTMPTGFDAMSATQKANETLVNGLLSGIQLSRSDNLSITINTLLDGRVISCGMPKNIDLIGRNYYGIPYVPNVASYNGVSTIYENVVYNGVQMIHNPYGFARITDCSITLTYQEAGELTWLEIGGTTTITKTNNSLSVFWFYGTSTLRPYMKILADAKVTVTSASYFMYESNSPDYTIEPGASITINADYGISYDAAHAVNNFNVGENALFRHVQRSNPRYVSSIYISGVLTVNRDAIFYMQADFSNVNRIIRFNSGSGGMRLENPKSFVLYNRGTSAAAAFYFTSSTPFEIIGGQVNFWTSATGFPLAGTFDDEPQYRWKRPDWSPFTLRGTASQSRTDITYNDFTTEELALLPPLGNLQLQSAQVFSVGSIPLDVNAVIVGGPITGRTEPYANVKAAYVTGVGPFTDIVIADSTGAFLVPSPYPIPFDPIVTIYVNTPFLVIWIEKYTEEEELFILRSPGQISFVPPPLAGFDEIVFGRRQESGDIDFVEVKDTRLAKTPWTLWASITGPLRTTDNDVLDEAVVFVDPNGEIGTIETTLNPLQTYDPFFGDTTEVRWNEDRGVLARIRTPIRSGKAYSTQMNWQVFPAGASPEGGE